MKAILKKIEQVERKTKKGTKFNVIKYTCDVEFNNGEVKTLTGSMSVDYAKKYFEYCKETTKTAINKDVRVVVAKRKYIDSNENERTISYIKFLNFIDQNGDIIIMPSADKQEDLDF